MYKRQILERKSGNTGVSDIDYQVDIRHSEKAAAHKQDDDGNILVQKSKNNGKRHTFYKYVKSRL